MTNEEIDKMLAGRALDALVAEGVMGHPPVCTLVGDGVVEPFHLDFPDAVWRERSAADSHWERFSPDGAERVINGFGVPEYSTDIAAAWLVVEKLRALWPVAQLEADVEGWCAEIHTDKGTPSYYRMVAGAYADTAPLAISRAALKAINTEDSTNV